MDREELVDKIKKIIFSCSGVSYPEEIADFILSLPPTSGLVPLKKELLSDIILDCLIDYMEYVNNVETVKPVGIPNIIIDRFVNAISQKFGQQKPNVCTCSENK